MNHLSLYLWSHTPRWGHLYKRKRAYSGIPWTLLHSFISCHLRDTMERAKWAIVPYMMGNVFNAIFVNWNCFPFASLLLCLSLCLVFSLRLYDSYAYGNDYGYGIAYAWHGACVVDATFFNFVKSISSSLLLTLTNLSFFLPFSVGTWHVVQFFLFP